jgi:hypothetical protein
VEDYTHFSGFIWSKGTYYPALSEPKVGDFALVDRDRSTHVGEIVEILILDEFCSYEEKSPISLIENLEALALLDTLRQAENDSKLFCQQAIHLLGITIEEIVDVEIHADVKKVIIRYVKPLGIGHVNFVDLIRYLRHNKFPGARIWLEDQSRKFFIQPQQNFIATLQPCPQSKGLIYPSHSLSDSISPATVEQKLLESKLLPNENSVVSLQCSIYDPEFIKASSKENLDSLLNKLECKKDLNKGFNLKQKDCIIDNLTLDFPVAKYPYYMCNKGPGSNFSLFSTSA